MVEATKQVNAANAALAQLEAIAKSLKAQYMKLVADPNASKESKDALKAVLNTAVSAVTTTIKLNGALQGTINALNWEWKFYNCEK